MARHLGFDKLVNLGDLLTYGCNPKEILDQTLNAVESDNMILIKGNHDQLYFDLMRGDYDYYNTLPEWIQESIDWTTKNICLDNFEADYPWRNHYKLYNMYFAHANPFKYGNWAYLNVEKDFIRAAMAMAKHDNNIGIFGHTHRKKIVHISNNYKFHQLMPPQNFTSNFISKQLAVFITIDSIGQPRNSNKESTLLVVNIKNKVFNLEFIKVPYEINLHKKTIQQTPLSKKTKEKIISFF